MSNTISNTMKSTMNWQDKIVLVTGASRGIGAAIAIKVASLGAHPILVARTKKDLEKVDDKIQEITGTPATLVPMDLRKPDQIAQLAASIAERFGKLDVLVGNAGVLGELSPVGHLSPKQFDEVMAVNVAANFHLIRCLDPLLRLAKEGSYAVFTTDTVTNLENQAYWSAYASSKAALNTLVKSYHDELATASVTAALFDPGVVATGLRAKAFPGEDPETLQTPDQAADKLIDFMAELPELSELSSLSEKRTDSSRRA